MAKKTNNEPVKTETVAEFLARGGQIQKIPSIDREEQEVNVRTTTSGPVNMISTNSNPFNVSLTKEEFEKKIKEIESLSPKEKEKLMDLAESMSELSYQSPGLEEAAIMFGEKIARKKKKKLVDNKEVERLASLLLKDIRKKVGL